MEDATASQERLETLRIQAEAGRVAGNTGSVLEAMLARISVEFAKAASEKRKDKN